MPDRTNEPNERLRYSHSSSIPFDYCEEWPSGLIQPELLASISGELKTPLTTIKGFVSTLRQPDVRWTEEEKMEFLETIEKETDRLDRLITVLVDAENLKNGAAGLEPDLCRIPQILKDIGQSLAGVTRYHRLQVDLAPDLPPVFADGKRIGQVIVILVEFAVKNAREGTSVRLEAAASGGEITVSISRKGGLAPGRGEMSNRDHELDNIYRQYAGAPVELPYCRRVVAAHRGCIRMDGGNPDEFRVCFTLPIFHETAATGRKAIAGTLGGVDTQELKTRLPKGSDLPAGDRRNVAPDENSDR